MEEGLNFKKVVRKIKVIVNLLLSKWKSIVLISILGASLGFYIAKISVPKYNAKSTFMVSSPKGGSQLSSLLGMASSLGLGSGSSEMSIESVSEVIISDRIVLNALLHKQIIKENPTCLGNYFIETFGLRKKWQKENKPYKDFKFTGTKAFKLSNNENRLAKLVLRPVKNLLNVDFEKQSNIITISCKSVDPTFSNLFTNTLIEKLTSFYVNKATQNERETFEILTSKTDSIKTVLQESEVELAKLKDNSFKTVKAIGRLKEMQLEREIGILSVMYSTSVSNVEMARVNLLQKKPFIQIIDEPILPLTGVKKSLVISIIIWAFLFFFFTVCFLIAKTEILNALK